jgi:hypothetical protein
MMPSDIFVKQCDLTNVKFGTPRINMLVLCPIKFD